jgi:hypothetical protein|tara:strand:+ start:780 stop:1040 length:261 start_codon:yes stop_codon:yes gene_type:complete
MATEKITLRWDNDAGYDGMYGAFVDSEGTAWNQVHFYGDEEIPCCICGKPIMGDGYEADGQNDYMEMCDSHAVVKGRGHLSKQARY